MTLWLMVYHFEDIYFGYHLKLEFLPSQLIEPTVYTHALQILVQYIIVFVQICQLAGMILT